MHGTIEPEAFVKLRRVINKHGYKAFMPRKEELLKERISYFKQKNSGEYAKCIARASTEYAKYMKATVTLACELINIEE